MQQEQGARHPLWLENAGQWDTDAEYVSFASGVVLRAERGTLGVQTESVEGRTVSGRLVRISFDGALASAVWVGETPLRGTHNYFYGDDPSRWTRGVRSFESVILNGASPGIDLRVRHAVSGIDVELVLGADAELSKVAFSVDAAESSALATDGTLVLETLAGPSLRLTARACWRDSAGGWVGQRCAIEREDGARFRLRPCGPADTPEFALAAGPGLDWSSFLGGGGFASDLVRDVAIDAAGAITVTGYTQAPDFPVTPGAFQYTAFDDAFVTRIDPAVPAFVYSSCLGGGFDDEARSVAIDADGAAVVAGLTYSNNFPVTPGAFDTTTNDDFSKSDGFVARIAPNGMGLVYSTLIGGTKDDSMEAVAIDAFGRATAAGTTSSSDFPTTPGAFDPSNTAGGAAVIQLSLDGHALVYSTYLGGFGTVFVSGLSLMPGGDALVSGRTLAADFPVTVGAYDTSMDGGPSMGDAFISRLSNDGSTLLASTFLGGEYWEHAVGVGSDTSGRVYAAGHTLSTNFPSTPGAYQASYMGTGNDVHVFIACFDGALGNLLTGTFLSGPNLSDDHVEDLVVDASGVVTIVGSAASWPFPTTAGSFDPGVLYPTGQYVARLTPALDRLLYSTFLQGSDGSTFLHTVDRGVRGEVVVGGATYATAYPVTADATQPALAGFLDGVVSVLSMQPLGVEAYGVSTPACLGPIAIGVTEMPVAGDQDFAFTASAAPPSAFGFLALGAGASVSGVPVLGVVSHLDLAQPIYLFGALSDTAGWAETLMPLPAGTTGLTGYFQFLWLNSAGCGGAGSLSASNALSVTLQ